MKMGKKTFIIILLVFAAALVVFLLMGLPSSFNVKSTAVDVIASAGLFGATLTILFRIIFNDYFSGLSVKFEKYFKPKDWVILRLGSSEVFGQIVGKRWRSIHIATKNGNMIVIPNKLFNESVFINLSRPITNSRFSVEFNLSPEINSEKAINIIQEGLTSLSEQFSNLKPKIRIKEVSTMGITYAIKYWLNPNEIGPAKLKHKVLISVLSELSKHNIYPVSFSTLRDSDIKETVRVTQELEVVS